MPPVYRFTGLPVYRPQEFVPAHGAGGRILRRSKPGIFAQSRNARSNEATSGIRLSRATMRSVQ